MIIAGIMSGTSLDGIDVAICEFKSESDTPEFDLLASKTYPFPKYAAELIVDVLNKEVHISAISNLNSLLSELYALSVIDLCETSNVKLEMIDSIAVHGQTVWHQPIPVQIGAHSIRSTLQLINAPLIAQRTGRPVIFDFRSADLSLGGQGAPLVPIFDYAYFRNETKDTICLNIGGIANITHIAPKNSANIKAFDTGPGNMLIDAAMNHFFAKDYDNDGAIARMGSTDYDLLQELLSHPFICSSPPKSTGREAFGKAFFETLINRNINENDLVNTLTRFTVESVKLNIEMFCCNKASLLVSGGGARNSFMIELLQSALPEFDVHTSDFFGIDPDFKEAIAFAYLAYLNHKRLPGNIPAVTGAAKSAILGSVYNP